MVVYWKKTGGNQGYQVQYSTSKRFSSNVKTVRLSAGKKSVTIKNIPAKNAIMCVSEVIRKLEIKSGTPDGAKRKI